MATFELIVPSLGDLKDRGDLENAIVGINGVAHIAMDPSTRTVAVEYDPEYGHPDVIKGSIIGAGYPVSEVNRP